MKISNKIRHICDKADASVYPKSKNNNYPNWTTINICPVDDGSFQVSLLKQDDGSLEEELFGFCDGDTLVDALIDLENQLDEYIDDNIRQLPQTIEHQGHTYILSK